MKRFPALADRRGHRSFINDEYLRFAHDFQQYQRADCIDQAHRDRDVAIRQFFRMQLNSQVGPSPVGMR